MLFEPGANAIISQLTEEKRVSEIISRMKISTLESAPVSKIREAIKAEIRSSNQSIATVLPTINQQTGLVDPLPEKIIAPIIGHTYSERQKHFLEDVTREAFFGGALAGGKTQALIAAALQYVHVPRYHAILFRRTRPNAQDLIDRLRACLQGIARFSGAIRGGRFTFPSGTRLDIGYMQHGADMLNYKGPEYHYIGWDELTEFLEIQYGFMFTRLRGPECQYHKRDLQDNCLACQSISTLAGVPLRVRSASNPDGIGRMWVKGRCVSVEAEEDIENGCAGIRYVKNDCTFYPSFVVDNPGIDAKTYRYETSKRLTEAMSKQLFDGSWRELEGAIFNDKWWRRYHPLTRGVMPLEPDDDTPMPVVPFEDMQRFVTIDTAHTSKEIANRKTGKKQPSWSVAAVWDYLPYRIGDDRKPPRPPMLFLRSIWRDQVGWLGLRDGIIGPDDNPKEGFLARWQPGVTHIENTLGAKSLMSEARSAGFVVEAFNPGAKRFKGAQGAGGSGGGPAKLERSHDFQIAVRAGLVFLPMHKEAWVVEFVGELLSWTGDEDETADQVDVASMAALVTGMGDWIRETSEQKRNKAKPKRQVPGQKNFMVGRVTGRGQVPAITKLGKLK